MTDYEEKVSGFKIEGSWTEVVEHGERITYALNELDITGEEYDEWNEWRPKLEENMKTDIENKTAKKASICENKREEQGIKPKDEMKNAKTELSKTYKNIEKDNKDKSVKNFKNLNGYLINGFKTYSRILLRSIEENIYRNLMTKISPYFFDNKLISANINKIDNSPPKYEFEVNINDDDLKNKVSKLLKKYSEKDRWHIHSPKDIESVIEFEGQEIYKEKEEEKEKECDPCPNIT